MSFKTKKRPITASQYDNRNKKMILNHLFTKYNEEFEVIGKIGQSRGIPGDLWGVRSKAGGEAFTVTGNITKQGYVIKDSYYRIYINTEYYNYIREIIKNTINIFDLKVEIIKHKSYSDSLTKKVRVGELYKNINKDELFKAKIIISFNESELNERSFHDIITRICNELSEVKLILAVTFYLRKMDEVNEIYNSCNSYICYINEFYTIEQMENGCRKSEMLESCEKKEDMNIDNFSPWQAERLCCLIYLDSLINNFDMGCLYDILGYMLTFGYDDSKICERLPNDLTKEEWDDVIVSAMKDNYLSKLKIVDYIDINEKTKPDKNVLYGHKSVCFMDDDNNAIVIFRGTYGDAEWIDDAEGMFASDTKQQLAAAEYIRYLREDTNLNIKKLFAAGHSKGGNKAQYAFIVLPEGYVNKCIAINGQGFSRNFMVKYKEQIKMRKNKIELLAERRDLVNCLGTSVNDTKYYEGRRGKHTDRYPYGQPIAYFHYPDSLRYYDSAPGIKADKSIIAYLVNTLINRFFSDEKYKDIQEETVKNIISLMMTKKTVTYPEIAESIVNLLLLFFELSCDNEKFDELLIELVINEADVLLATIGTLYDREEKVIENEETEILAKVIRGKLAKAVITNPKNFEYFYKFIKKVVRFLKGMTMEMKYNPELINYLYKFFDGMFSYMKENSSGAGRLLAMRLEEGFNKLG